MSLEMKSFDGDRFNKQTSHQELLLENTELRQLLRDFLNWYDDVKADECELDEFLKKFREVLTK
jgi:hypothetical protein